MSKFLVRTLAALALCTFIMTGSAFAQGRGHGRGASNQGWRADRPGDRWTFGSDQRPHGWSQGRKTGWGNCDVPPGQAKKMGCNSGYRVFNPSRRNHYSRRDRDRDRDHDRRFRR